MLKDSWQKFFGFGFLFLLLVLVTIIRLNFLDFPFERDEGLYAHFASLILDGKLPYEAFYDPKPPGLFYSYAFIMAVFGQTAQGLHLGFLLVNLASIVFIYLIANKLWSGIAAIASAIAFAVLSLTPHAGGLSVLSEHLVVFWSVTGLYLLILATEKGNNRLLVASGLAFGFSLFVKQNGIFFIAAAAFYMLYYLKLEAKSTWVQTIKRLAVFGFCALLPSLLLALYLVVNGLGDEYYYWAIKYPAYLQDVSLAEGWKLLQATLPNLLGAYWIWWLLALIGAVLLAFVKDTKTKVLLISFSFFSFLSIAPRLTFHGHYFLFLFPAFALLVGLLFSSIKEFLSKKTGKGIAFSFTSIALMGILAFQLIFQKETYFKPNHEALMKEIYGINPFLETKVIAKKVEQLAKEGDQMVVYGGEMQLYFYTGLDAPTKHLYGPYLVDGTPEENQRQREFIEDVEYTKPRFFVAVNHPLTWVIKGRAKDKPVFHWYSNFIKNYQLIGLAEMNQGEPSQYIWGANLESKELQADFNIFVWYRREQSEVQ